MRINKGGHRLIRINKVGHRWIRINDKYKIIGIFRVRLIISYFSCLLFINKFYLNIFFFNKISILFSDCNTYKLF